MSYITSSAGNAPRSPSAREAFWRGVMASFALSNQTIRTFCRARGVSEPSFYAWRRTLGQGSSETPVRPRPAQPAFVPVIVEPGAASNPISPSIEVELRGGRVLRLPGSMPASRLAEVLHALEGRP